MRSQSRIAVFALAALLAFGAAAPAQAGPLDDAKAAGYVGERIDGTLGIVRTDTPADVRKLADEINAKRMQSYQEIATKQGIPVEAVAAQAGKKLIARTPSGQYIQDDGKWVQVP